MHVVSDIVGEENKIKYVVEEPLLGNKRFRTSARKYKLYDSDFPVGFQPQSGGERMDPMKFIDWNNVITFERITPSQISIYICNISDNKNIQYTKIATVDVPEESVLSHSGIVKIVITDEAAIMNFQGAMKCVVYRYNGVVTITNLNKSYDSITML